MKAVGEILSEKRKELNISLDQVEKETKIRKKYLEAIEKNNFQSLQESTAVKGFIRNYALFLGLSAENLLAVFRRDFIEDAKGQIIARGFAKEQEERSFHWTPKGTFVVSIIVLLFGFSFVLIRQYFHFSSAPPLEIFSPQEDQIFNEKVLVSGRTDKDATVKIEGALITVEENGNFEEEIVLPRGENVILVEAENRQGKKRTENIKVKVE